VIGRWVTHALIYLSACSTVSLVWVLLTSGTVDDLKDYARTPGDALNPGFWPVWLWLLWGTAVAMHLAVVVGRLMPGRRRRGHSAPEPRPIGRRHLVAMFTDLTGSTTVNERLGDEAWAALVADHRRVVRDVTAAHGGLEVSTQGDGFFVRFDDPMAATDCAVALQNRCRVERAEGSDLPPVRIGIHQGDAVHEDDDILGQVVNVAARLLDAAAPDEILVTEPVADGIGADRLEDRGLVTLKGMAQPRHVLSLRWDPDITPESVPDRRSGAGSSRRGRRFRFAEHRRPS
jgi:class 3 adenylate cyclase